MTWSKCGTRLLPILLIATVCLAREKASVSRVALVGQSPFQLQIHTDASGTPESQIVSDPERLVIDIPNASPGVGLHGLRVDGDQVKGVRCSLFSTNPLVTRIVVDLKQPQWYRIVPNANGYLVSLGTDSANSGQQPTIGWVATKFSAKRAPGLRTQLVVERSQAPPVALPKVSVQFANGLMTIHADNSTLSEVLFEIQKQTGAEIAIPSGTEGERVAADFGPGPASEVLEQLLNGSGLNFVVVGSATNPNALKSVILSRNTGPPDAPSAFSQAYTPVPAVEVPPTEPDAIPQPDDDSSSAPPTPPPGQPPMQAQPQAPVPPPGS